MNTSPLVIAVVAPSGSAADITTVERAIARLESLGCVVRNYYDHDGIYQRFGGSDSARLVQLHAAAADPDVHLIMVVRGGYGVTRLLPHIDFEAIKASGKIMVGFSDITALHMGLMARAGGVSYAGPMIAGDFGADVPIDWTLDDFWRCLAGPAHTVRGHSEGNPVIDVRGTVWGGNLAMICSLIGTPYFPRIDDGILFLEDVGEHPYRIERMLLQLSHAGVLARQKAVLLGDFSAYRLSPTDNGYDFGAMLEYARAAMPVPILTGLPFGHGRQRVTIPVGAHGSLRSDVSGFELTMSGYPTRPPV